MQEQTEKTIQSIKSENVKLKYQLQNQLFKYEQLLTKYYNLQGVLLEKNNQLIYCKQLLKEHSIIFDQKSQDSKFPQKHNHQLSKIQFFYSKTLKYEEKTSSIKDESKDTFQEQAQKQKNNKQLFQQNMQDKQPKSFNLIEGCFIIQKTNSKDIMDCLKFYHPKSLLKQLKQLLQLIVVYTFNDKQICKLQDDEFDSRKNEINFGSSFEDVFYAFQNNAINSDIPLIMKKMNAIPRRYIHSLLKPQIIQIQSDIYQTETIYGFISPLPLRPIFFDLNRLLLKEIKYQQLKNNQQILNKDAKYQKIANIMQKVSNFLVNDFPIVGILKTGIASIEVSYPSILQVQYYDRQSLAHLLIKTNFLKVSKIIHYVLAEKHLLIVAKDRKTLNQFFQIIRLSIYPFNWLFPIVYSISPQFYPYLQSPMPLIAGCIQQIYPSLPKHQFITIFLEEQDDEKCKDLLQIQQYGFSIEYLYKKLTKCNHKQQVNVIKKYLASLRKFIETGNLPFQIQQFHIDFMETQLVSYYKQKCINPNLD